MPYICNLNMKYIRLKTTDPYYNLAVEEYLLKNSDEDIFMLWQNSPSVIIGKNQNAYAEVDLDYAKIRGINVVRRITGGGAVYHDGGNVNYTFITSEEKATSLDYSYFTRPVIDALASLGLECKLCGRNDLEIDGKKVSGNAQFSTNGRILHHGTLLFDADVKEMSSVLRVDKEKLEYKAVKSHKSRVTNISLLLDENITVDTFIDRIEAFVLDNLAAEASLPPETAEIDALRERNAGDEWIYSDKRYLIGYSYSRRKKFPYGIVKVDVTLEGDIISGAVISGDFFERASVQGLEDALVGKRLDEIASVDPSGYVDKMTVEDLIELIK